jgi:glycosyltransferase involved in cell wall biosynthesis
MRPDKILQSGVLDLSKEGVISPELARVFNQIADDIRYDYIELVNKLSTKYRHNLDWFVTPFACRNTYVCSAFEEIVRILFVIEVVARDDSIDTIIVDSPFLAKVIKPHLPGTIEIKAKKSNVAYYTLFFSGIISGLFKYIIPALARYISYKLALLVSSNKSGEAGGDSKIIVETYLYNNSFKQEVFHDRHFPDISTYLNESQANRLVYIPTFYRVRNPFKLYLKAFKSKTNFLFVEKYLTVTDIFYPLRHVFTLEYMHSNIKIRDIDISQIINHSLARHCTHTSSLLGILKYRFCCRLKAESSITIAQVVRWYENQEIDHGSIMGWRRYSDSLHVNGYMGFFASSNYLCAYPIPVEHDFRITPDYIGVMGGGLVDSHKKFCENLNIKVVPSFRFSTVSIQEKRDAGLIDEIKILVTLPISQNHIDTVLNVIVDYALINDELAIQFLIKPHPASKFILDKKFLAQNNVQYDLVDGSMASLFEEVDVVLSTASSTLVEAMMHGIPVILASSTQLLRENVIPEFVPDELWEEVFNAEELYCVLKGYKQRSNKLPIEELNKLNARMVEMQADRNNVPNLLLGFDS